MKRTLLLVFIASWLWADAKLSTSQMGRLNRFNHRSSVSFADTATLKRFAGIDRDEARAIAHKTCGVPESGRILLKRKGRTLYYDLDTPGGSVTINALDGSVIRCAGEKR